MKSLSQLVVNQSPNITSVASCESVLLSMKMFIVAFPTCLTFFLLLVLNDRLTPFSFTHFSLTNFSLTSG